MENQHKILASVILASGLACAGFFPGYYYYKTHYNSRVVTVKGLAEQDVTADMGIWNIQFTVNGNNLSEVQRQIEDQAAMVTQFLENRKFTKDEISVDRIETNDLMANPYRDTNSAEASRLILTQNITVRSTKVSQIAEAMSQTNELIGKGIIFSSQNASYFFTKLNEVKPALLKKSTQNANAAAIEFAENSHSKVGKIYTANQGVISIQPRDDPNASETSQINKKIRVVSTITYLLED